MSLFPQLHKPDDRTKIGGRLHPRGKPRGIKHADINLDDYRVEDYYFDPRPRGGGEEDDHEIVLEPAFGPHRPEMLYLGTGRPHPDPEEERKRRARFIGMADLPPHIGELPPEQWDGAIRREFGPDHDDDREPGLEP